jgi:hypothetical protein
LNRVVAAGLHSYFYDAENRIIQVNGTMGQCSTAAACYVYDAEGHRVRATVNGQTRDFIYDLSGRNIDEFTPGGSGWLGTWTRGEAYAGSLHIATYANGTTEFDNSDWLTNEVFKVEKRRPQMKNYSQFHDGNLEGLWIDETVVHVYLRTLEKERFVAVAEGVVALAASGFRAGNLIFEVVTRNHEEITFSDIADLYDLQEGPQVRPKGCGCSKRHGRSI